METEVENLAGMVQRELVPMGIRIDGLTKAIQDNSNDIKGLDDRIKRFDGRFESFDGRIMSLENKVDAGFGEIKVFMFRLGELLVSMKS